MQCQKGLTNALQPYVVQIGTYKLSTLEKKSIVLIAMHFQSLTVPPVVKMMCEQKCKSRQFGPWSRVFDILCGF